ncbi:MAG: 2Fe-2S iron-sulfur cluster-binding protein [Cyanobacteria bacterium J06623_7]
MLNSLGKIQNPLVRSITAGSACFALVTIISFLAIGLAEKGKNKEANKMVISASLLALVAGAGAGLLVKGEKKTKASSAVEQKTQSDVWQDWRDFKVIKKQVESKEITSFYLQPADGKSIPDFKPGQYLTIKLDTDRDRPVIRTYSLSDYPESQDYYRLSIKREGAPKNLDVPPGVASNFMHDHITEGSIIPCKPPKGNFYLEVENSRPAILISNGVGITPMISMAKACARQNPQRHVWFIHGARNGEFHACGEEVNAIKQNYPNLYTHYCYSRPRPEDEGKFHSQGYADKQLIADTIIPEIKQNHDGSTDAEYFLCGSPAFMDSIRQGLDELEVPEERVFFESFGGGKTKGKAAAVNQTDAALGSAEVTFASSNQTVTWTPADGTLLEFAEANGLSPDYSCRQGVCHTCTCTIQEGEVEYTEEPAGEPDEGNVLICVSRPKTNKIVLDL